MKIEFLHHYRQRHRLTPARPADRLSAALCAVRRASCAACSICATGCHFWRSWANGCLGFSRDAQIAAVVAARPIAAGSSAAAGREVVLLVDTFNRYFEPENARAAERVLTRAGYRVVSPDPARGRPLCCGRTFLAAGLVDEARKEAGAWSRRSPHVAAGTPIVGLEPSCLLTLRDEFPALLPAPTTKALAGHAQLFEEFVDTRAPAGRFQLTLKPMPGQNALLHGHCHQKAFATVDAAVKALQLIPDLTVETFEFDLLRHGRRVWLRGRAP